MMQLAYLCKLQLTMRHIHPRELQFYQTPNGREPFTEWFESIQNQETRDRIQKRLDRLALGNFGDCGPVGRWVFELRIHFGAGYRIYFGEVDNTIVTFCFVPVINHHRHEILNAQKTIG